MAKYNQQALANLNEDEAFAPLPLGLMAGGMTVTSTVSHGLNYSERIFRRN